MNEFNYPGVVCEKCALKYGGRIIDGHIATYYEVTCDICKKTKICTEPRDYGHLPKFREVNASDEANS